jgi:GWxTD domain-containing protein
LVANLTNTFASKITSRDTLALYIDYLYPISTDIEKSFAKSIIANDDVETLQRYFLNFWVTRNSAQPEQAWFDYHQLVKQANHEFKSVRIAGYKTDRGRVYLQYGQPNAIAKSYTEPSAFPYEIWQYYDLQGQRDRKFVFYTRDIATNDFQLIHSNAVGELAFYRWQTVIYQRTNDPYNLDTFIVPDSYGSFSRDYYVQPR